jgi:class 3 adenylate cyclase
LPFAAGREIAAKIPGARFLPLEGNNHLPRSHEEAIEIVRPVIEFLTEGRQKTRSADEILPATVMFTDIEGSTSLTHRLGDEGAQMLVREHNETVRRALVSYNGKEIKHTGMASWLHFSQRRERWDVRLTFNSLLKNVTVSIRKALLGFASV